MVGLLACQSLPAVAMPTMEKVNPTPQENHSKPGLHLAVFGTLEIRTNANLDNGKWRTLIARSDVEAPAYTACVNKQAACLPRIHTWREFISQARSLTGIALLNAVNARINQLVVYGNDIDVYGESDHWATPIESLSRKGDCEDYAILKYMTLAELGVSEHRMKIVIVNDKARNIAHAVVTADVDGETWILDNLRRYAANQSGITNYQALYSVNRYGKWLNLAVRRVKPPVVMAQQSSKLLGTPSPVQAEGATGTMQIRSVELMARNETSADN